jgi:hypothetical protein
MKEFLPDGMDFDETILKAKDSYRKYRERILDERKEAAKKNRSSSEPPNKLFIYFCKHEINFYFY